MGKFRLTKLSGDTIPLIRLPLDSARHAKVLRMVTALLLFHQVETVWKVWNVLWLDPGRRPVDGSPGEF
jgi:hypothetical protein